MKETTADRIRAEMTKATQWLAISDLCKIINRSASTIRRNLLSNEHVLLDGTVITYKSQKIPGDLFNRRQWALQSADTTGWTNASPLTRVRQRNSGTGRSSSTPQYAMYGGLLLMCAPANKPSLVKAVGDLLVSEFVTSGKRFSAYDVTKRLRELVLTQPIVDQRETGAVHIKGVEIAKIEHEEVKAIVHDIFNAGGMPNLGRVQNPGKYWEYDTQANIDAVLAAQTVVGQVTAQVDPAGIGTTILTGSAYDGSSTI